MNYTIKGEIWKVHFAFGFNRTLNRTWSSTAVSHILRIRHQLDFSHDYDKSAYLSLFKLLLLEFYS